MQLLLLFTFLETAFFKSAHLNINYELLATFKLYSGNSTSAALFFFKKDKLELGATSWLTQLVGMNNRYRFNFTSLGVVLKYRVASAFHINTAFSGGFLARHLEEGYEREPVTILSFMPSLKIIQQDRLALSLDGHWQLIPGREKTFANVGLGLGVNYK